MTAATSPHRPLGNEMTRWPATVTSPGGGDSGDKGQRQQDGVD